MEHHNRGFLNNESGLAAFEWEVSYPDENPSYICTNFKITDCSRQINLDFSCDFQMGNKWCEPSKEERLGKIDLMIRELQKIHTVMAAVELVAPKDNNE